MERSKTEGKDSPCRSFPLRPREEQRGVLPKSILRSTAVDERTELVKEGEEGEGEEEEAVSAAAAPLIISSVAGGRA